MDEESRGIRILIANDYAMVREALRILLEQEADLCVIGEACTGRETVDRVGRLKPDVLLLDMVMPQLSGLQVLRRLAASLGQVRTIIFADSVEDSDLLEALHLGARGVLPRHTSTEHLIRSVRAVYAGEYWLGHRQISNLIDSLRAAASAAEGHSRSNGFDLTRREIDVVQAIVDGETNKEIAKRLAISEQTVKHHLTSIYGKVGVSNRLELALFAMHQKFTS